VESVLIYDGDCGFCTTTARWAARKFGNGARAMPWQFLDDGFFQSHRLSHRDVQEAAWWVDSNGRRERGHRAVGRALQAGGGFRRVAGRLVLTWPTSWVAAGVYRLIVRWRYRLPGGTPACNVDAGSPTA
jgi:predicted DCC family thiol-disulfide oxidoreductase YuxK